MPRACPGKMEKHTVYTKQAVKCNVPRVETRLPETEIKPSGLGSTLKTRRGMGKIRKQVTKFIPLPLVVRESKLCMCYTQV